MLDEFKRELEQWRRYDKETVVEECDGIPVFANEFWTSKQRAAHSLHEVSYRACFKPQLPRFFIERLTDPGDVVFDPFMGRGTTLLEAVLLGRDVIGNDVNPLSRVLVEARLDPPARAFKGCCPRIAHPFGGVFAFEVGEIRRLASSGSALVRGVLENVAAIARSRRGICI